MNDLLEDTAAAAEAAIRKPIEALQQFLRLEAASGLLLMAAAGLALLAANTPLDVLYDRFLDTPIVVRVGEFELAKPLLLWINDGLMAVFFTLVALEVKRELLEGELASPDRMLLPGVAALGGVLVPIAMYAAFNHGDAAAMEGWAIPAATDIAFALGVLSLLGDRIPVSLKLFLLVIAIIDDLSAILIIAVFYSHDLSPTSLGYAAVALVVLVGLNLRGLQRPTAYVLVGIVLWVSVLKSGVHATLAGVALGFAIPLRGERRLLSEFEDALHPWVAYLILPLFAFANAGVTLGSLSVSDMLGPVPLGIALGLLIGKTLGVFGFSAALIGSGLARLPASASWGQLLGVSMLCGIGFTMSLFIGSLAFERTAGETMLTNRVGILAGSILSAVLGYALLRWVSPAAQAEKYG